MADDLSFFRRLAKRIKSGARGSGAAPFALPAGAGSVPRACRRRYPGSLYREKNGDRSFDELSKDRGALGEYLLYDRLRRIGGRFLFNLYLPHRGRQTEIDLILICARGVFLFESKNYSGEIYGLPGQREWVHVFRAKDGLKKQRFFNPLMQNEAHGKAVCALLPAGTPVFPVVVFGKDCRLHDPDAAGRFDRLTTLPDVKRLVRSKEKRLTEEEIGKLYALLAPYEAAGEDEKRAHIAFVSARNAHK